MKTRIIPIKSETQQLTEIAESMRHAAHSIFGPSSAHMWAICAGSLIPNILTKDPGNIYAATGSVAHWVSEVWLRTGKKPKHLLGTWKVVDDFIVEIDHEMMDYVQSSIDRCINRPGRHLIEQRLRFTNFMPIMPISHQGGTMDFAVLNPGHAYVIDHKYGIAEEIMAENNFQAMLYALLLYIEWDWMYSFKSFTLAIHQPRLNHFDEWTVSVEDLLIFAGWIKERARLAWRLNAPRTPEPHACRYCKVRSTCAANLKMQFALSNGDIDDAFHEQTVSDLQSFLNSIDDEFGPFRPPLAHIPTLDTEKLAIITPYRTMVNAWWNAAQEELLRRGLQGEDTGKQKIVLSSKHRVFKDEIRALAIMADNGVMPGVMHTESIVSPAKAVEMLVRKGKSKEEAWAILADVVIKPKGTPTLAALSDKRHALVIDSPGNWRDETPNREDEED